MFVRSGELELIDTVITDHISPAGISLNITGTLTMTNTLVSNNETVGRDTIHNEAGTLI